MILYIHILLLLSDLGNAMVIIETVLLIEKITPFIKYTYLCVTLLTINNVLIHTDNNVYLTQ